VDIQTYALLKKYVNDTLIGIGALKGAPCEVQGISKVGGVTTVTLKWEDTTGGIHTSNFDVNDGVSVSNAKVNDFGNLIITLSDGTTIDCGKVNSQFITLPTPSASNVGAILQYIGTTTSDYINGYFYECILDGGAYRWIQKDVQPNSGGGGGSQVNNLPPASASEFNHIYQYVGTTTTDYENGCFYKCIINPSTGNYEWTAITVLDSDVYENDPIDFNHW